jgi:hypothetical protein
LAGGVVLLRRRPAADSVEVVVEFEPHPSRWTSRAGILDKDRAAGWMAARRGLSLPADLEARLELHLAVLHELAAGAAPVG